MLQQEQSPTDGSPPVSQIRVTPEELTRAIASLEAQKQEDIRRQEEEAQRLAGTLPIGEAAEDLSLEFTPEEIWQEIKRERKGAAALESAAERPTATSVQPVEETEQTGRDVSDYFAGEANEVKRWLSWGIAFCCLITVLGYVGAHLPHNVSLQMNVGSQVHTGGVTPVYQASPRVANTVSDDFYQKLRSCQGRRPQYHIVALSTIPSLPSEVYARPGEMLYPMRAVPDGYSVYYYPSMFNPANEEQSGVTFRGSSEDLVAEAEQASSPHPLIGPPHIETRYDGERYLRCWIASGAKRALQQGHAATLYFSPQGLWGASSKAVPVTLPLWNRRPDSGIQDLLQASTGADRIFVPDGRHLALDSHTWDPFPILSLPEYTPPAWTRIPGALGGVVNYPRPGGVALDSYAEFDANSVVTSIGELGERRPFHCGTMKLAEIDAAIHGRKFPPWQPQGGPEAIAAVLVDTRPALAAPHTLVKMDGQLYLRGWIETRMTEAQMREHNINVYDDADEPALGYHPTRFTVGLDQCVYKGDSPGYVTLSDIHLDQHAWEKW